MPAELDRTRIERFLDRAASMLQGDWVLVGGAAAAVWFLPDRTTEDIDLVGAHGTNAERLRLMEVADSEGLPVETVNSAADYYVRRVSDWNRDLVEIRRGTSATIYRPTATVYVLLKLRRLSEQDLDDCRALLAWCETHSEALDRNRIRQAIRDLPTTDDEPLAARRQQLAELLEAAE